MKKYHIVIFYYTKEMQYVFETYDVKDGKAMMRALDNLSHLGLQYVCWLL
jgi:hypothetical protein